MSTIIIDAGSTKMEWVLLSQGKVLQRFTTPGFNPNYADIHCLDDIITSATATIPSVQSLRYYGTGCGNEQNCIKVKEVFLHHFPQAEVQVTHDLMGACHALFGKEQGIACILGTGANSCQYDGHDITERAVSLGYLVGDEGSGCYIGRKLVRAYFYDLMPLQLKLQFKEFYHMEISDFIDKVYHQPEASKYLAGFSRFAGEHQDDPFIRQLVKDCFKEFIQVFVLRYKDCRSLPVGFVGSVASHFKEILKDTLNEYNLQLGEIIASPMEGLIAYTNNF